ncbi:repressor phrH2, partial [Halorubrum sp. SP3]
SITTWGELFLSEDVDPSLDVPVPSPRPPHATRPDWWAGF